MSIQFQIAFSSEAIKTRWTDFLSNLLFDIVSIGEELSRFHFLLFALNISKGLPFSSFINRIVSTLMCWISSMSLKSGFSSLDELSSCNLSVTEIKSFTLLSNPDFHFVYLDEMRLNTALKLFRLRANKTLEANAFSWLTIAFSFGKSEMLTWFCFVYSRNTWNCKNFNCYQWTDRFPSITIWRSLLHQIELCLLADHWDTFPMCQALLVKIHSNSSHNQVHVFSRQ